MKFAKENVFVICAVAVVLVGCGGLVALARSVGTQFSKYARQRSDESTKIADLRRSGVNRKIVKDAQQRVGLINKSALDVAAYCLSRNRGEYKVITFDVSGKKIKAFPIDRQTYERWSLRWRFPEEYKSRRAELLKPLNPTMPPTKMEVDEEFRRMTGQEAPSTERPLERRPMTPDVLGRRDLRYRDMRSRAEPSGLRYRAYMHRQRTTTTMPTTAEAGAPAELSSEEMALRRVILAKSRRGWVYADVDSLYQPVVLAASNYTDADLWTAQLSLWIEKDILEAISWTNREAQRGATAEDEKGVPSSAIKRLVSINIRDYVVKPSVSVEGRRGIGRLAPGAAQSEPQQAALRYLNPGNWGSPPTLTGRASSKLYDVVHYDFTVVLSAKYLRRLYKNIRLQNFHTILDVQITQPGAEGRTGDRAVGSEAFHYGTEPVVQAEIAAEVVMFSDWTRGRWNARDKAWDKQYPPLMPAEVLENLNGADSKILREEDKSRIKTTSAAQPSVARPYDRGLDRRAVRRR